MRRVAVVAVGDPRRPPAVALLDGLRELGYVEGKNLELLLPAPGDDLDGRGRARLASTAVERKAEVIVALGSTAARAAQKVTTTIPIVILTGTDLRELGMVRNLARPEGNITGIAYGNAFLVEKRLELLKEIVPGVRRLGVLFDPAAGSREQALKHLSSAATRLGMTHHLVEIKDPTATRQALAALTAANANAIFVMPSNRFLEYRNEIVQIAAMAQLPASYSGNPFVRAGGLLAYSADSTALHRRAADFVDRLLKGAKPAELPIEQPTKFDFAVNLRTARTLGLSIPPAVLVRADEVIQ